MPTSRASTSRPAFGSCRRSCPGVLETNEFDNPGMHTTDTVDMEIMLSGEVILELDNGLERTLRTGDVNIQNGTRHRWHNRGTESATMAVFIAGASRS
jgi:hypothetical protein